ncbi:MAG TPA: hypothetical protein VHT96_00970 [Clostridia bacterium]|nr:hypothetical protein [Clostridia bacterium]
MDELFITICVIGFTLTVLSPYFFNKYTKFKLELEKMRLDSELKKEAIRAKNQFEIEKYFAEEQLKAGKSQEKQENYNSAAVVERSAATGTGAVEGTAAAAVPQARTYENIQDTELSADRGREKLRY